MTAAISPSLTLYLNDIGNHELLNKADEVKLSERIRKGNAAKEKMEAGDYRDLQQLQRLERTAKKGVPRQGTIHPFESPLSRKHRQKVPCTRIA